METQMHPLDYEKLVKGQSIPVAECERIFGMSRRANPEAYQFAIMGLCKQIEDERKDLWAVGRDYGVAILQDNEAVEYMKSTYARLVRKMGRLAKHSVRIDRSQLTAAQARTTEFYALASAASASDMKRELRKVREQERLLETAMRPKELKD